ncbi:hypothetical protein [Legionella sp. CNM-4043-24]|uniref:hypothetical protein n=1 Tax=Legionella sp. CNM-4043-24 TaxID=3421646 RepID=UPI00403AEB80
MYCKHFILAARGRPIDHFLAGLLIEDRIPSVIEEKDSPEAYWEKRVHDAISMYAAAAADKKLKPVVDFILWEIKTTTEFPSVCARLGQYELIPSIDYLPSRGFFSKAAPVLPDLHRTLFFKPAAALLEQVDGQTPLVSAVF